jgi:aspartate carbamoyltransferase catalytic subunit
MSQPSTLVRHVIDSAALPLPWLEALMAQATHWLEGLDHQQKNHTLLANRTVVTLFQEPSTRTRASFELAAQYLGAKGFTFSAQGSSFAKGESLEDTIATFIAMGADAFVLRHGQEGLCQQLVAQFGQQAHFISGGEGISDHPTQGLLDLFTLVRQWGWHGLAGKTVAIVGDVAHSRVAGASLGLLPRLGVTVRLVGPPVFCPTSLDREGVSVIASLEAGLQGADAVMALRVQNERLGPDLDWSPEDYIKQFQITPNHLTRLAKPGAPLLHPGPTNWGVELSPDCQTLPASRIVAQVRHGVAVRMAVLAACLGEGL